MKKKLIKLIRKCFLLLLFTAFVGITQTNAQQIIKGQVIGEDDVGIPGVNVLVEGTNTGEITDFDGNFTITASTGNTLIVSFLGFITQKIVISNQTNFTIKLLTDVESLDDVIVIGYGSVKKSDLTGSVSQVTARSFEDQPLARLEEALQGRASGVTVAKANGSPGGAIKVRIRGVNSITGNNDPLIVIDGFIGGDLSTLNPNDIASLDVLKDASATAIYGSRGSNGVVLVTTKKGKGKTKVNVDYFTTISTVPELLPTLGAADFARLENSRRIRGGGNEIFTAAEISEFESNGGTNYQDEILKTGITQNLQLSASGSEGKIGYFISGNYVNQEGIVINTNYERYSLRSNLNAELSKKVKVGLNVYGSRTTTLNNLNTFQRFQGSAILHALTWDPTTPIRDEDGAFNNVSEQNLASLNYNPVANLSLANLENISDRLDINLNISYNIFKNTNYTLVAGVTTFNSSSENYRTFRVDPPSVSFGNNKNTTHQVSNILTWAKEFGNHNIKATGVYEFSGIQARFNGYRGDRLEVPGGFYFVETAPGSGQFAFNNFTERAIQSLVARAEYIYDKSLFFTGTIRQDAASVFAPDNRVSYYPSAALAYSFNKLGFIENSDVFNSLKLRAGWGQVGNQEIPPYSQFPSVLNAGFSFDGTQILPGVAPDSFGNADIKWETTTQTNVGLDLGFFNGRVNLSIDAYQKNTEDLLLREPVDDTNGGGTILKNIGEVENQGVDISISGDIIRTDNFNWNSNFNISFIKNKVIDLGGVDEIEGTFGSIDGRSRTWNIIQKGEPLGQFNGATFLGTWKTSEAAEAATFSRIPGDAKYLRDENGEIVFGVIGNGTPTLTWGFNNSLSYKNWDLNIFFQGVHGFDVLNAVQGVIVGNTGNQRSFLAVEQLNQWTPENETDIPAGGDNEAGSTRFVEKGDFIRLSNLTLGYTLPSSELLDGSTIKLYLTGQNLFLITDYSGYDPESTSRSASNQGAENVDVAAGINAGAYPNPRSFIFGVKVGF
ncbi:TonB-dependent receptor [Aquimarina sp. BL5]|uniref:SusC/RagA family TonB-linked outer membrane protein n=1 Tax=Aquimarina sp. BL5 TaxID=1714860 RepID=UPI000EC5D447|nr:TonB-dependent receptor [Aquimarina sp. BL5]RKN00838.1 TonB-dependent receptor [Aquimarina sp. BL5]